MKIKKPIKTIQTAQFCNWENDIVKIIQSHPDDRKIYWYVDKAGGAGKTSFSKYLVLNHNAGYVSSGKPNDIKFYCAGDDAEIYVFDYPRSIEGSVSYQAIEEIKNGIYFVGKYESQKICRNPPHVFVFANFYPDLEKLSVDRWVIVDICATATTSTYTNPGTPPRLTPRSPPAPCPSSVDAEGHACLL